MIQLHDLMPDVDTLLSLPASELAGVVLKQLVNWSKHHNQGRIHRYAFCAQLRNIRNDWGTGKEDAVETALAEALSWLEAHGLIAEAPEASAPGWFFVTRAGRQVEAKGFQSFRQASELPRDRLHPAIADRCHAQYMRGELDSAVFEAYKTLEVEIRSAAELPPRFIGKDLARRAFAPSDGALSDQEAEPAEQQALADLMAGALGSYKNPHSHRRIAVTPEEAVEMIILASHLLRIVDSRRSVRNEDRIGAASEQITDRQIS